ncbi:MAG: hypothetical protein P4L92_11085 [Rudaea sp.]|nr:hypothetical protein [Rudaea sp.]
MNTGGPAFAFAPNERAQIVADAGRSDVATIGFIDDVEACLQAFDYASISRVSGGLPEQIAQHLSTIVHTAAQLRGALYRLPGDVAMLIDLHLLSDGARRRVANDLSLLVEPLEDIAGAVSDIQHAAQGDALTENVRLEDRLVRAIATIFRNRLNRKPTSEDGSGFPSTLRHVLKFAGYRMPRLAAAHAAVTPARLRALLGDSSRIGSRD